MSLTKPFPGFTLRLTRFGAIFLAGMLFAGLAAVNTGNNALVMMLGIAMGSFVMSGTWSRQVLGKVQVRFEVPRRLHAGTPVTATVTIRNRSRVFPAYGLVVRDESGARLVTQPFVEAGGVARREVRIVPPARGWQTFGPWRLDVVLPLGFFVKSKLVGSSVRRLVYPHLRWQGTAMLARASAVQGSPVGVGPGRDGDFRDLREYRVGDERRQIHWKQSARQQRLIVIERNRPFGEPVFVVVDPRLGQDDGPSVYQRFEAMVSQAATVVVNRLQHGVPVGVVVGRTVVRPCHRPDEAEKLLRPLALVRPEPAWGMPPAVPAGTTVIRLGVPGGHR